MSFMNLVLWSNWPTGEWPECVEVMHEGAGDSLKYVPERTCTPVRLKSYAKLPNGEKKFTHYNYFCSECCRPLRLKGNPSYCRHCGARIKEER